ncbi:MAG: hypothetical protein HC918_10910 [Oscillatoriales cyanobacterium SM2_1_8]|nr:hypothetical protein [Oscillatoriales cyanobacterium SM2_1_8]
MHMGGWTMPDDNNFDHIIGTSLGRSPINPIRPSRSFTNNLAHSRLWRWRHSG